MANKEPNHPDMDKKEYWENLQDEALSAYDLETRSHNSKTVEKGLEDLKKNPMVFHPNHYTVGGIETIDFIVAKNLDYFTGNAVKYISRSQYKGKEIEDLEKAIFYLQMKICKMKELYQREIVNTMNKEQ